MNIRKPYNPLKHTPYCIRFNRSIANEGGLESQLVISPDEMLINGISFDNHWVK